MKVLIVDDSLVVRRSIARMFNALSLEIELVEAENGKQALKALTMNIFDFIVTDLEMDGGAGENFIHHLQNSSMLRKKPVIVYSSKEYAETLPENIMYVNKGSTSIVELGRVVKELIFKFKICPKCESNINGKSCLGLCFTKTLDPKWQEKFADFMEKERN